MKTWQLQTLRFLAWTLNSWGCGVEGDKERDTVEPNPGDSLSSLAEEVWHCLQEDRPLWRPENVRDIRDVYMHIYTRKRYKLHVGTVYMYDQNV